MFARSSKSSVPLLARGHRIGDKIPMSDVLKMAQIIARHTSQPGIFETLVSGVWLIRADAPGMPMPTVYEPSLCIIAQGSKTVSLGARMLHYDHAHCLVASVDLALVGQVIAATPDHPYLCCKIDIDQAMLADLITADGSALPPGDPPPLAVHPTDRDLLDAVCRCCGCLIGPRRSRCWHR
jgi:AraC-type transcriptional regulator N-terminus